MLVVFLLLVVRDAELFILSGVAVLPSYSSFQGSNRITMFMKKKAKPVAAVERTQSATLVNMPWRLRPSNVHASSAPPDG